MILPTNINNEPEYTEPEYIKVIYQGPNKCKDKVDKEKCGVAEILKVDFLRGQNFCFEKVQKYH